jgi:DNA repair protein RecO (recombination protein O)
MRESSNAYLIHSMPYQETSVIARLFTEKFGKVSVIAKGVRRKNHKWRSLLNSFNPITIDIKPSTKPDGLAMLYGVDQNGKAKQFEDYIVTLSLFYINELIHLLVPANQPDQKLYDTYVAILGSISISNLLYKLRLFELALLEYLGYGLHFENDSNHEPIEKNCHYLIKPLSLPEKYLGNHLNNSYVFKGIVLLELLTVKDDNKEAKFHNIKKITKLNIDYLLEGKSLESKRLLQDYLDMKKR